MNDTLFDMVCNKDTLYSAWLRVKEKNTTGGIDFKTVQDYAVSLDKNLDELVRQLQSGVYIQQPYREVFIPKNENEKRRLGLLTVNDKIVQTAVTTVITPVIEHGFLHVSYAYRVKKGAVKAINQVRHLIVNEHYSWLAVCDIDNFFDTIPHDILFGRLSAYLKSPETTELIKMFVTMGRVTKRYHWKDNRKGLPQGGVVSPLLANFYLYALDKIMVEKGYGFVRYADDFVILGRTQVEAQQALSEATKVIIKELGLALNEDGCVVPVQEGFEFLGIFFNNGETDLSEKKTKRLVAKMAEAADIGQGLITLKLTETLQGIATFYAKLVSQEKLQVLDDELLAILKLRWEKLKTAKSSSHSILEQLQFIELFAKEHIIHRTEYLHKQLGLAHTPKSQQSMGNQGKIKAIKSREAVLTRKHEYQKLESSGFDLAITQTGLFLGKKDKMVAVHFRGSVIKEIPFVNLRNISVLCDGVSFSSNLVKACAENKISIDFFGKDGIPYSLLLPPSFFSAELGMAQLVAYSNGKGLNMIRMFVYGKINNQANLIKYYGKYYLKRNNAFKTAFPIYIDIMEKYAEACLQLEHRNIDEFRLKMFAIEGQASARYWEMVELLIRSKTGFVGRERQGATDLVNCMLNYGYGMLYARITEAIVRARLNPC